MKAIAGRESQTAGKRRVVSVPKGSSTFGRNFCPSTPESRSIGREEWRRQLEQDRGQPEEGESGISFFRPQVTERGSICQEPLDVSYSSWGWGKEGNIPS